MRLCCFGFRQILQFIPVNARTGKISPHEQGRFRKSDFEWYRVESHKWLCVSGLHRQIIAQQLTK